MHLPSHLAMSWLVGHRDESRKARLLIAWAGVAPDVDALAMLFGQDAYAKYHHVFCHGVLFALVTSMLVFALTRSLKVALLACAAFHLHLAADLLGSGREWPIRYFFPFSEAEYGLSWGWELASWQNTLIMLGLFATMVWTANRRGRTFAESFLPARVDAQVAVAIVARSQKPKR